MSTSAFPKTNQSNFFHLFPLRQVVEKTPVFQAVPKGLIAGHRGSGRQNTLESSVGSKNRSIRLHINLFQRHTYVNFTCAGACAFIF